MSTDNNCALTGITVSPCRGCRNAKKPKDREPCASCPQQLALLPQQKQQYSAGEFKPFPVNKGGKVPRHDWDALCEAALPLRASGMRWADVEEVLGLPFSGTIRGKFFERYPKLAENTAFTFNKSHWSRHEHARAYWTPYVELAVPIYKAGKTWGEIVEILGLPPVKKQVLNYWFFKLHPEIAQRGKRNKKGETPHHGPHHGTSRREFQKNQGDHLKAHRGAGHGDRREQRAR